MDHTESVQDEWCCRIACTLLHDKPEMKSASQHVDLVLMGGVTACEKTGDGLEGQHLRKQTVQIC